MQTKQTITLVAVVLLIAGVIVAKSMKQGGQQAAPVTAPDGAPADVSIPSAPPQQALSPNSDGEQLPSPTPIDEGQARPERLPKLLDLGSVGCVACKKMEPVLAELDKTLAGEVDIEFIDIYQDGAAADQYGIKLIPTQIFLDAEGEELHRQTGAHTTEEITSKMRELGMLDE